jgi:superfamily II DNA or RNA helicase
MTIQLAHNAVTAKLYGADDGAKMIVQQALSYAVVGRDWTGRSSFFNYDKATFPAGFAMMILARLTQAGHKVQLVRAPFPAPLGPMRPEVDAFGYLDRYDYQPDVTTRLLKHGQIIAQVATGGGKSRIAKIAVATISRKMAFLTTRGILMYQMADNFKSLGHDVGVVGDGTWAPADLVNVGMVQTLGQGVELQTDGGELNRYLDNREAAVERDVEELTMELKEQKKTPDQIKLAVVNLRKLLAKKDRSDKDLIAYIQAKVIAHNKRRLQIIAWLHTLEFVILEEAHEASGNSYYEVLKHCKNAHYRLSLTATPFMKDDEEANMRLMACSGPVAIKVTEKLLIDRGILAKPYFKFVGLPALPAPEYQPIDAKGIPKLTKEGKPLIVKLYRSTPWQKAVEVGIVNYKLRNTRIIDEARRAVAYGMSVMILVRQKAHGKILKEMLLRDGMTADYIFGEDSQVKRRAALYNLKEGHINVLIGSTILDVGVDVPAIGMVILAGGGKAEVGTRQRIGRGLREKHTGPNIAFIVDFNDTHNNHLKDHARERQRIIATTDGFKENIVADFNFESLGFKKAA